MKQIINIFLVSILLATACTRNFDEINDNPNFPTVDEANPALILPKILFETGNQMTAGMAWGTGNTIAQLTATNNFTGTDRYLLGTYSGTWNLLYRNMRDAQNLYDLGESLGNKAYQGAALTLKAWLLANTTELWGSVPYSEALKGKQDIFAPKYDDQREIYESILSDLENAAALSAQGGNMRGDILYFGDSEKWERLANSLRLRYLMRLEKKWGEMGIDGASQIQAIADTGKIFRSNDDNGAVAYLAGTNRWPLNTSRVGSFDEKRMSQRIETVLKDLNDPRMSILFRPVDNPNSDEFVGVPNGLSEDEASNFNGGANNQSRLGRRFREEPAAVEMIIMHYSEAYFILAEAAEKGYINGDAADFYRKGVQANLEYYGIEDFEKYLSQASVQLGEDNLVKIAEQKWLSLFMVGNEAWYDFRRTGLPELTPGPNATINEVPSRVQYPTAEQVLNESNYKAVVGSQGPDEITTKMWILK